MCDHDDVFRRMRAGDGPAWRWNRAGDLVRHGDRPDCRDDTPTMAAWELRGGVEAGAPSDRCEPPAPGTPLSLAHAIYADSRPPKWELEARLLTGLPVADIARRLGIHVDVVQTYADTFFDVVQRLDAPDWIWLYAVRVGFWGPAKPTEADLWRYVAASGGPAVLDVLVSDFLASPGAADEERHELAEDIRTSVYFVTTPMKDKKKFRQVMQRMWRIMATRVAVADEAEWQRLVAHMDFLEMAAGLRPTQSDRREDRTADQGSTAAQGQAGDQGQSGRAAPGEPIAMAVNSVSGGPPTPDNLSEETRTDRSAKEEIWALKTDSCLPRSMISWSWVEDDAQEARLDPLRC